MKSYHDIAGDGGSKIVEQVVEQQERVARKLAGVRHRVAIGSGKGGVGKSTLTLELARALRRQGREVAILDATTVNRNPRHSERKRVIPLHLPRRSGHEGYGSVTLQPG